jgi:TonB-linked SusC/RagA family outer membrane protein
MRKIVLLVAALLFSAALAFAQKKSVRGVVNDENGAPISYATIGIKGSKIATSSDENGNFTISADPNAQLLISAVGYGSKTVAASDGMTVSLNTEIKTFSTVTVSALGFKKSKDQSAFSNSSVRGDAVVKSGEANLINGLTSKAAGLNITRTGGDPGAGAYIQIRGQSSISGNLQPLIVVDGIPISNSTLGSSTEGVTQQSRLNDINPNDIENYEVLKGAAAAALWGTRAANGVIMITTKKGKNTGGKVNISYTSTYSVDQLNRSVPLQQVFGLGTSGQYRFNFARSWGDKIADRAGGDDIPANPNGEYLLLPNGTKRFQPANGTPTNPHGGKNSRDVYDHSKELFQNGHFWDNSISLSGGDDRGAFMLSLGNMEQKGILKAGSDYKRRTVRFNSDRKMGAVKLAAGLAYTYTSSNRVQQGSNLNGIFLGGLRTPADFDNSVFEGTYVNSAGLLFPNRQVSYRNQLGKSISSGYDNPFWVINRITNLSEVHRFIPNLEASVKISDWLSIVDRMGIDYYLDSRKERFPSLASGSANGGLLTQQTISESQINNDLMLRAEYNKLKDITLSGVLGYNYNNRNFENIGGTVRSFILPDAPPDLGNSARDQRTPFNSQSKIRVNGAYLQGNIGYKDMLFLDVSGRYEQYSTVKEGFFYPSASLAYVFRGAAYEGNKNLLSFGKFRVSYGQVGVQAPAYAWDSYYFPTTEAESWGPALDASSALYGGGFSRSGVQGNPGIRPEIKSEIELGTDLRFWNDRISLSATYFNNKTKDVILAVQVPSSTGFDNKQGNIGNIKNNGFELELGANWVRTKDLRISSNFIFSRYRNQVVDMGGTKSVFLAGFTGSSSRAVEGQPLGVLWGVDFLRDVKGGLVLDANGFPQQNSEEGVIGDPNPDWTGALNTSISWKGLNLSFLFDRVQGGDVWNGTRGALYEFGTHADMGIESTAASDLKTVTGGIIAAGTTFRGQIRDFGAGPVALTQPWFNGGLGSGFGPVGSQFVEDGTRTRLREVSLGYTLRGDKFRRKTRLNSIDFSITGRNLALWTKYTGIDPETNLTGPTNGRGLDYFNNPSTKSYFFTIKINY